MSDTQTEARAIAAVRDWLNGGCSSWGLPSQQIETLLTALAAKDAELAELREAKAAPAVAYWRSKCQRAEAQLAEARKALANYDRWLNERDAYIVRKGLWQNFVASLPGSPTARRALEAQECK